MRCRSMSVRRTLPASASAIFISRCKNTSAASDVVCGLPNTEENEYSVLRMKFLRSKSCVFSATCCSRPL